MAAVFTDGACSKNGKKDAQASYSAVLYHGSTFMVAASGLVEPYKYIDKCAVDKNQPITPSNNRGEILGVIHGILVLLDIAKLEDDVHEFEIVSDSKITINTLAEWLPNRRAAGTAHKLLNMDLLEIAEKYLAELRTYGKVVFTHVHSHVKEPDGSNVRARFLWLGNDLADKAATEIIE